MRHTGLLVRGAACVAAVILALTSCASNPEPETGAQDLVPIRFHLGFFVQGVHAPWVVGQEKGFFEEEGIDIEIIPSESPIAALGALQSGDAEFASTDLLGLALAKKEDPSLDVYYLAPTYAKSPYAFYSLRSKANIDAVSDLEGKTIHGPAGGIHSTILPIWLREHGIDNVVYKEIDPASRDRLLVAGKVPIVSAFVSNGPAMAEAAADNGDELLEVTADDEGMADTYAGGVSGRGEWIEENPELTRGFIAAYIRSFTYAFDHPEETARIMSENYPEIPEDNTIQQVEIMERLMTADGTAEPGHLDPSVIEHTIDYTAEALGLEEVDVSSLYMEGYGP